MIDTSSYEAYLEVTDNEIAAAILVLADRFRPSAWSDDLAHEICMAIRKGLYGAHASDESNIEHALTNAADTIASAL